MNPLFERAEELGDLQTALEDLEEASKLQDRTT
jgi:hypothetical protein